MKLGIIGVGHLSTAILKGLLRADFMPAGEIVLSPRGHSIELCRQFGFQIAESNTSLVENCDTILLSVRPQDAVSAVIRAEIYQKMAEINILGLLRF